MAATTNDHASQAARVTNYKTLLYAGGVVLTGILVLWLSTGLGWFDSHSTAKALAEQLGGLLVTTGGLAVLWDLRGRRDMINEVLARVELRSDLEVTGLQRASMDWRIVPWAELITEAKEIDVFIAYGSTWLSTNSTELATFAKQRRNKMQYILPDPEDETTMAVLAARFEYTPEVIKQKIYEAARSVAKISRDGNADIRVRFRPGAPTFTCYRFDNTVVVTLYTHQVGRGAIPTFVLGAGSVSDFFRSDLHGMKAQGREVGLNELLGEV